MARRYGSRRAAFFDSIRALRSAFGNAGSMIAILVFAFAVIALGWFGDSLYRMWFQGMPGWAALLPLMVLIGLLTVSTGHAPQPQPEISEHQSRNARGMIMFLSPTKKQPHEATRQLGDFERDPWQMPLVALQKHWSSRALEYVAVIPSADSGKGDDGTWRQLEHFRQVVDDVVGMPATQIRMFPENRNGVNFESAHELHMALEEALSFLRDKDIPDEEIVIDITGGQKVPAVLGGVIGLGKGLRIQYVSTRDLRVMEYDLTLEVA